MVAEMEWHPGELVPRIGCIITNLSRPAERVVAFQNRRGKAEQYVKGAIRWTRLSCRKFRDNAVRLQFHVLAYNLANFTRTPALPKAIEGWSLTILREKLVKIRARVVAYGRYAAYQLAEAAVLRDLFPEILSLIDELRPSPAPAYVGEIDHQVKTTGGVCLKAKKVTEWPSNRGPIIKIVPSDGSKRGKFPWRWDSGTTSTKLAIIWEMSD